MGQSPQKSTPRWIAPLLALCALTFSTADAQAQSKARSGAIGVGLGQGTGVWGLSFKTVKGIGMEAVVGRALGRGIGLNLSGMYELPVITTFGPIELGWNAGLGGTIGFGEDRVLAAASGIVGLEFNILPIPLDIVLDWRPTLVILPDVDVDLIGFGGHIRFYF